MGLHTVYTDLQNVDILSVDVYMRLLQVDVSVLL